MKCKRINCSNPVKNKNQVYCSAQCAPYGNFISEDSKATERLKKYQKITERQEKIINRPENLNKEYL